MKKYYKLLILIIFLFVLFFIINKNTVSLNIFNNTLNKINIFRYINNCNEDFTYFNDEKIFSLESDNKQLKEALSLKDTYSDYSIEFAKVITRNKMYFFKSFTIDKGKDYDLEKGLAVISKNGLIGIIDKVYDNNSKVKLISDLNISVLVDNNIGMIDSFSYPYLIINTEANNIKKDNQVYTTGYESIPKNIKIGTVEKIENNSIGSSLYVKVNTNINDINYVGVLK